MLLTIAVAALLYADDLNPQTAAVIAREQAKAQAKVAEKYGNKKSSELSTDERRQMIKDQVEAEKAVLEKYGVDARDFTRYEMKQGRAEREAQQQAEKALADKEQADAEKAKAGGAPKEIPIQRGFSDQNPVVLEEKEGAAPRVDTNLPPEAIADQDATKGEAGGPPSGASGKDAPKDAPKKGGGKHK